MSSLLAILLCMAALGLLLVPAEAEEPPSPRLCLASQLESARGFSLQLEGSKLQAISLILDIGDGEQWRRVSHPCHLTPDRSYQIRAVLSPERAQLFLDERLLAESVGTWQPATADLNLYYVPSYELPAGDWLGIVEKALVGVSPGPHRTDEGFGDAEIAVPPITLWLFDPFRPTTRSLEVKAGDSLVVETTVRLVFPDIREWSPFVDRYGQCRYGEWTGKVISDEQLQADIAAEEAELATMPLSSDFDEYGGYLESGWQEEATGFFRVVRRDGFWWLITPAGNPCFHLGVCGLPVDGWPGTPTDGREFVFEWLPLREGVWAAAWSYSADGGDWMGGNHVSLHACNLIRKYGEQDWQQRAVQQAMRRTKSWHLAGGKWGAPPTVVSTPVLGGWSTPRLVRHPDIFDPEVCRIFREELESQVAPRRDDPMVLGWSFGNEYDEIITQEEVKQILGMSADVPAKRALLDYAVRELYRGSIEMLVSAWGLQATDLNALYSGSPTPPAEELEKLRCHYADRYYDFLYRTVKSIDPNHLYLGNWIVPGWWVNEEDWHLIARHCDIIGYERYSRTYPDEMLERLQSASDKPTLCGEFAFPPTYHGQRGFARWLSVPVEDDREAGDLYYDWMKAAAADPSCVGMIWFIYLDEPITGRGDEPPANRLPGHRPRLTYGEHVAFGLVTETDRVKWPLVKRMREANLQVPRWRLKAAGARLRRASMD